MRGDDGSSKLVRVAGVGRGLDVGRVRLGSTAGYAGPHDCGAGEPKLDVSHRARAYRDRSVQRAPERR